MPNLFASCYRIYDSDRAAILAACPDANLDQEFPHGEDVLLGTARVKDDDGATYYEVDILVGMLPAHFYTFRVRPGTSDGRACEIGTGSGAFADYWPAVVQVATGMLVVKYPTDDGNLDVVTWEERTERARKAFYDSYGTHDTAALPAGIFGQDIPAALAAAFSEFAP